MKKTITILLLLTISLTIKASTTFTFVDSLNINMVGIENDLYQYAETNTTIENITITITLKDDGSYSLLIPNIYIGDYDDQFFYLGTIQVDSIAGLSYDGEHTLLKKGTTRMLPCDIPGGTELSVGPQLGNIYFESSCLFNNNNLKLNATAVCEYSAELTWILNFKFNTIKYLCLLEGDVNNDGIVNGQDVTTLYDILFNN